MNRSRIAHRRAAIPATNERTRAKRFMTQIVEDPMGGRRFESEGTVFGLKASEAVGVGWHGECDGNDTCADSIECLHRSL